MLTSHWSFTSSLMTVTVSSLLHKFELNWLYWVENYVSPHHRLYINHHLTRLSREVVRCQMSSGPRGVGVVKWGECCPWLYCIEFNWIWWWFDVMVLAPLLMLSICLFVVCLSVVLIVCLSWVILELCSVSCRNQKEKGKTLRENL